MAGEGGSYHFPTDSVFCGAKTWYRDLPERELAPGKECPLPSAQRRDVRQRLVLRNGTVISSDARKRQVTVQPPNATPIVLRKASLRFWAYRVEIETPHARQSIGNDGSYNLFDKKSAMSLREQGTFYTTYSVSAQGAVTAERPEFEDGYYTYTSVYQEHRVHMSQVCTGQENAQGYIQLPDKLVAPLVAHRYLVEAQPTG